MARVVVFSFFVFVLLAGVVVAEDFPICIDMEGPAAVTGLSISGNVYLSWNAAVDRSGNNDCLAGVSHYEIYRDGSRVGRTSETYFNDGPLSDGTYSYEIVAYDNAFPSNLGDPSEEGLITIGGNSNNDNNNGDNGDTSSSSCFPAGTKISMADGTLENIEDVKIGEYVLSYNILLGKKEMGKVLELESPIRDHMCEVIFDGNELKLTKEHPVYTLEGWKSISPAETAKENSELNVKELEVGDGVLFEDGNYRRVKEIGCFERDVQTYNLKKIERYNNFYADGVLVHNKGGGSSGGDTTNDSDSSSCVPNWFCTEWGTECIDGLNVRACEDKNNCGDETTKPDEFKDCNENLFLSSDGSESLLSKITGGVIGGGSSSYLFAFSFILLLVVAFFVVRYYAVRAAAGSGGDVGSVGG